MEHLWFASKDSGAERRDPNSHKGNSRSPGSRHGHSIMNNLTCSPHLAIRVSPDLNFKELAQVQVCNEYKAELEEATLLHPSSGLHHTGFRGLPAAFCSTAKNQAWPRAIGARGETNEKAEKLNYGSGVVRREGLSKSIVGCSVTVAAALPNPSLKLSTNGVSRRSSGAGPAAHFAALSALISDVLRSPRPTPA